MLVSLFFEILVLILCLLISAFFSASEAVIFSIHFDRMKQLIEEGGEKAKELEFLLKHSNSLLTSILIGNNLTNIFAASFTTTVTQKYFQNDVLSISVGISTFLIVFFGEIIPKTFGRNQSEKRVVVVIKVLRVIHFILFPLVKVTTWFSNKFLGKNAEYTGRYVTTNDLEYLINKAEQEKTIDSKQIDLLTSILEFPTIKVKDIMLPREKISFLSKNLSFSEITNLIRESNHSRYPVCDESLDKTIGLLHVKDLLLLKMKEGEEFKFNLFLKPPFYVYHHMKIQAVFDHMNRKKMHMALVKDDNGIVVGMVTLEDIMEEIFGEIDDEYDQEENAGEEKSQFENGWLVDGLTSIWELNNEYELDIPLDDKYSTLNGYLLDMIGNHLPKKGMMILNGAYLFTLEKVKDGLIKEVRIKLNSNN